MIYLYLKIHNKTGMKYLGKTVSNNPEYYTGSGKLWKRHISKYGYDVKTVILLASECPKEIKETGLFFSKLFNIVKSKDFANLMEETGDGGNTFTNNPNKEEIRKKLSQKGIGRICSDKTKEKIKVALNSIDRSYSGSDDKMNNAFSGKKHTQEAKEKSSLSNRRFRSENSRKNKTVTKSYNKGIPKTEEHKRKLSEALLGRKPSNSRIIVIDGKEFIGMKEASEFIGIPYSTIRNRIKSRNLHYANIYDKSNKKLVVNGRVVFEDESS
jgi:hypothetical protein